MKESNITATLKEYAAKLAAEKLCGSGDVVSMRGDACLYATREGANFAALTDDDILKLDFDKAEGGAKLHAAIYRAREDINAICLAHPAWVAPVAKAGVTIPAVLDDMAQIVGPSCKTTFGEAADVIKTLKGRNSCLIKDGAALTAGRTMDEAFTCVMVLDKAAHCYVASAVLGDNVVINGIEARLMRFIYKKKYSKVNQENITAKEEGK